MEAAVTEKKQESLWQLTPRVVKIAIIIVVLLILALAAAKIYRIFRKPANANYIQAGGGAIPSGWTPDPFAEKMFAVMDGSFTLANTKNDAAGELMNLNDNQLISIYNYWNDKYSTKSVLFGFGMWGTLPEAMGDEWNEPVIAIGGTNYWTALKERFQRLGLK